MSVNKNIFLLTVIFISFHLHDAFGVWKFSTMKPSKGAWGTTVRLSGSGFNKDSVKVMMNSSEIKLIKVTARTITFKIPEKSKTGWIEISQDGRNLRSPTLFTIVNDTQVTDILPPKGPHDVNIVVRGYFFNQNTRFYLNYLLLESRIKSESEAVLHIPRNAKTGVIYFTNQGKKIKSRFKYSVVPLPSISGVSPEKGWSGDILTLRGSNFCKTPVVKLNSKAVILSRVAKSFLKIKLPSNVSSGRLEILCHGKTVAGPSVSIIPPYGSISSISPDAGPPGTWVTLKGSNFSSEDKFWIGSSLVNISKFIDSSTFKLQIPANASTDIIHHQSHGKVSPSLMVFNVVWRPLIKKYFPRRGWYGDTVELTGLHFCKSPEINVGNLHVREIISISSDKIRFKIPNKSQTGKISLKCSSFVVSTGNSLAIVPPDPLILRVVPENGPPGTLVRLHGKNFHPKTIILFGKRVVRPVFVSQDLIKLVIPGNKSGKFTLVSPLKQFATSSGFKIAYSKPVIHGFYPANLWHSSTVVIAGSSFCINPNVSLKSDSLSAKLQVVKATSERIVARLPEKAFPGKIQVSCHGMNSVSSAAVKITAPVGNIVSVSPVSGPPGTWITLKGSNFRRRILYYIGGQRVKSRFISPTEVELQTTSVSSGKISFKAGNLLLSSGHTFSLNYAVPKISSVSPDMGWTDDKLTLKGANFCTGAKVFFEGGKEAKVIKRYSHTTLMIKVPAGAASGNIRVSCAKSTGVSEDYFTVAPPYSRVISINKNVACGGDKINIRGINFTGKTKFFLGEKILKARIKSSSEATVTLPGDVRSGDLKVMSYGKKLNTDTSIIVKTRLCGKKHKGRR
ncbi:MAG: IPT/TIG domain-containing protein [Deltaproteobacteria bacterium]|nr:IPT/TIG domain-containing protein [Deltaproteobacteria bacterium]